jgi:hypothetical protein
MCAPVTGLRRVIGAVWTHIYSGERLMQNDPTVKQDPQTRQRTDGAGQPAERSKPEQGSNHGEGNPEAATRFNKAEQEFVKSERGQNKIREGANVRPDEEAQLEEAERTTRSLPTDAPSNNR